MGSGGVTPTTNAGDSVGVTGSDGYGGRLQFDSVGNPFTVKVGQIFTGFGVGCGVGIGVGRPIYLGAIPALQQVLTATRGATDIFSVAGRHLNSSLRKLGVKGVEAGIGCGVGFGHGFGVGIAIKPSAIHQIQSCIMQALSKITTNIGMPLGAPSIQNVIPSSLQRHVDEPNSFHGPPSPLSLPNKNLQTSSGDVENTGFGEKSNGISSLGSKNTFPWGIKSLETSTTATRTEKVISDFLQNPILRNKEMDSSSMVENLQSENNILHTLLKHQQMIEKLVKENEMLRKVLISELKISPSKFQSDPETLTKPDCPYSDCFKCRRRRSTR